MASTVPAKSQPLHNFTLPQLKWNKDGHSSGHHHRRRPMKSPSRRPNASSASPTRQSPPGDSVAATPPRHQSPLSESAAASSPRESPVHVDYGGKQSLTPGESSKPDRVREGVKHSPTGGDAIRHLPRRDLASESEAVFRSRGALIEYRRNHSKNLTLDVTRNEVYSTNSDRTTQNFETKSKTKEADGAAIKGSKILIKIPSKPYTKEENQPDEPLESNNNNEEVEIDGSQGERKINNNADDEIKTWNLRPRKPIRKSLNENGITVKNNGSSMSEKNKTQSPSRNLHKRSGENEGKCRGAGGKKEKRKLSIRVALSKEEIEEDVFALTGSKPARRPKKRAKNIQKQLEAVFPGLWLVSITADSYKVSENSLKG